MCTLKNCLYQELGLSAEEKIKENKEETMMGYVNEVIVTSECYGKKHEKVRVKA